LDGGCHRFLCHAEPVSPRSGKKRAPCAGSGSAGTSLALTDQNTLNYFIYKGEAMGTQLALLESFAQHLGVPLRIIASNDIARLTFTSTTTRPTSWP